MVPSVWVETMVPLCPSVVYRTLCTVLLKFTDGLMPAYRQPRLSGMSASKADNWRAQLYDALYASGADVKTAHTSTRRQASSPPASS